MFFNLPTLTLEAPGLALVKAARARVQGLVFLSYGCADHLGTRSRASNQTDVRVAPGWLSVRRPVDFLAGRKKFLGTELLSHSKMIARAATGWLSARASSLFSIPQDSAAVMMPHSEIFLKAGANVLGIDRDPEALAHARARLHGFGTRFSTWEGNFSGLLEIPEIQQGSLADGLLLDLGVSSRQLDTAARGFSFMREGPLDMRMGPSSPHTAAEVVNRWDEADITRILFEFGEEPKARRIASALVKQRAIKPFTTTLELAACIEAATGRHGRTHPATRAFQAIRMAVNEELESLARALAAVPLVLKPGGRLLVITFHSLEDRMVKRFLRHRSAPFIDDPGWPEPRPNPDYQFEILARKAITPTTEETTRNPRARSAKLRVARLIDLKP